MSWVVLRPSALLGCGWLHRGLEAANPGGNWNCAGNEVQVECTHSCPELAPGFGGLWAGQGLSGGSAKPGSPRQDAQPGFGGAEC